MIGIPGAAASDALDRLHNRMAQPVLVRGGGLADVTISAIRSVTAGDLFHGPGRSARRVSFELRAADLPSEPTDGMLITDADNIQWRLVDAEWRGDVDRWSVTVERV